MVNVTSVIKLDSSVLRALDKASITALEQTGQALLTEVRNDQVIPFDTGTLSDNTSVSDYNSSSRGVKIVSNTPYARRMYYHPEYNFQKTNNPNAKGKWYDDYVDGNKKDFCKNAYGKLLKRDGGL